MTQPKEIATLPPLPVLRKDDRISQRTGEPRRPVLLGVAHVVFQVAAVAAGVAYAIHWWQAVHPDSYLNSAHLIQWLEPDPGKWLSLTLEVVLAALIVIVTGACGVAGFQAWNGRRVSRWTSLIALAVTSSAIAWLNLWAIPAAALALVGVLLLQLPPIGAHFTAIEQHRSRQPVGYHNPEVIHYGRLPRFR